MEQVGGEGRALRPWRRRLRRAGRVLGLCLLWLWLVCYPNPWLFLRNFLRYAQFPVDPSIITRVPFAVPERPAAIERAVLEGIRYEYDWRQYGVPWYVPTPAEVMATGRGDCESRATVFASLLAARGIPYRLKASLVHIWVDYDGKKPNAIEDDSLSLMRREHGRYRFQLPDLVRWRDDLAAQKEGLWDAMPRLRQVLLLGGWTAILLGAGILGARAARPTNQDGSPASRPTIHL